MSTQPLDQYDPVSGIAVDLAVKSGDELGRERRLAIQVSPFGKLRQLGHFQFDGRKYRLSSADNCAAAM